jgi:hypothetical protein
MDGHVGKSPVDYRNPRRKTHGDKEMFQQILMGIGVAIVGTLVKPLFSWLRGKANEQKILNRTKVDDLILQALEIGVSNVANSLKPTLLTACKDGVLTESEKKLLRDQAIAQAKAILKDQGIELAQDISEETVNAIIRRLVDATQAKGQ